MQNGSVIRLNLADPRKFQPAPNVPETLQTSDTDRDDLLEAIDRLRRTCEELRSDMDWMAGEIRSLRGHITGGSRRPKNGKEEVPQPVNDIESINQLIRNGGTFRGR